MTDRTLFWFCRVYGLDFADAHRLAEYEALTDEFHAIRVSLLMAGSKCSFEEAVIAVAITDSDFDREELAEEITIKAGAFIVNQKTGRTWQRPTSLTVTATRNQDSGCMEFDIDDNRFYVMEAEDYEVAA